MMKNIIKITILALITLWVLSTLACSSNDKADNMSHDSHEGELYTCGMHPNVIQEGPGNCPICGMYLTPMNDSSNDQMDGSIEIDPVTVQNIGVRTVQAINRDINQEIRTFGSIEYDETQVRLVQTKYSGWVEKIYADKTGQKVKKGEVLLEIYSPLIVTAQQEYIELFSRIQEAEENGQSNMIENLKSNLNASRKRLINFDISIDQIEKLEKEKEVTRTVKVISPFDGIIDTKHVEEGMEVMPSMKLYSISDVNSIWVYADIYEYESLLIKKGLNAEMTLSFMPGETFMGKVDYVYPYLDKKTRTLKVRLVFPNTKMILKPGMYANVTIETDPIKNAIVVPSEAVIFSGERNLVFVSLGEGRFAPRDVIIGIESGDGFYEIKDGLKEGGIVVTSAQFLLDSESKLQESISKMMSSKTTSEHSNHIH